MKQNVLLAGLIAAVVILAAVAARQHMVIAELKQAAPARNAVVEIVHEDSIRPVVAKEETTPPAEPPAPLPVAASTSNPGSNFMAGLAGMMKNPAMKEVVRSQQKMMLDRSYGALFKYLNRPAGELDALKQLLSDRQMALTDAGLAMMGGSAEDRKKAIEESKTVKADYDKKIQDLLGTQDYQVFQDYEKTIGERMQVQMFKDALPSEVALSDQQEFDLIGAMYEERKAFPASSMLNNQNSSDPSQLTEERIAEALKQYEVLQKRYADRAAAILTPSQLEQFMKFMQQMGAMQVAGLKMAAQMFGNKSTTQPPAGYSGRTP